MTTSRIPILTQTILKILDECTGHALPESTLREHLDLRVRPRVTDDEWAERREWLLQQAAIRSMPGAFGSQELRWLITESGQVQLRQ